MELNNDQETALKQINEWYDSSAIEFKLGGLAGTGKSSLIPYIAEELNSEDKKIRFLAPTNKASVILKNKLDSVHHPHISTIHKYLYFLAGPHCQKCPMRHRHGCPGGDCACDTRVQDRTISCHGTLGWNRCGCKLRFVLDAEMSSDNNKWNYHCLIVDEASMIDKDIYHDIIKVCELFSQRVIFIGDHGQLPPIGSEGFFLMQEPDYTLHDIQRQAKDSAIIKVAYEARQGKLIRFGKLGNGVNKQKLSKLELEINPETAAITYFVTPRADDQLVVGQLNEIWRNSMNQKGMPAPGEVIINLKNTDIAPKGCRAIIENIVEGIDAFGVGYYRIKMRLDDGSVIITNCSIDQFKHSRLTPERTRLEKWTYGYALTGHQAQGSEFDDVVVFEPNMNFRYKIGLPTYARWLYTAITRAKKTLTLVQ